VVDTTNQIVQDNDVQEQLSIYAVDQLYANVDVKSEIARKLPSSAQPLAAPLAAASQQVATNVAERALASPRVQALVSGAVGRAQDQFVNLIEDKGKFVSTTGGVVTFEYGAVIADLAARLGVNPATISHIQGVVQESSVDLRQRLSTAQTQIQAVRTALSQAKQSKLSSQVRSDLQTLNGDAAALRRSSRTSSRRSRPFRTKFPPSSKAGCPTSRAASPRSRPSSRRWRSRPPRCSGIRARRTSSSSTDARLASGADRRPARPPGRPAPW
jgi:hypothetical protein